MFTHQHEAIDLQTQHTLAIDILSRCYPPAVQGHVTLLCHSENATYRIDTPAGHRYALRVHKLGYHQQADVESELNWLNSLHESGIQVPRPVSGRDGRYVQKARVATGSMLNMVLFHWVDGCEPTADVDPGAFMRLGAITAKLHKHSQEWQRPAEFQRIVWDHQTMVGPNGHWGNWRNAARLDRHGSSLIEDTMQVVAKMLSRYGQNETRYGLIHADLRLTNLLIEQDKTHVIDFDDCGLGWYMHDLAAAVSFHEHHERLNDWIENWLCGYATVARLEASDIAMIPTFIIQRRIQLLAWTVTHSDTQQVRSLEANWVQQSVELCQRYLDGQLAQITA
jgi:Ser/Thr protein kinase RdoA (MazF antagonist)